MDGDAEAERKMLARRHAEQRSRLHEALLRGDDDIARVTVDVPPTDPGRADPDDLEELEELDELDEVEELDDLSARDDLDEFDDALDDLDALEEPAGAAPRTADREFREHRHALLYNLEWARDFLPPELLADWAQRVAPLDLERAEEGVAAIEAIGRDYRRATEFYAPHVTEVSRGIQWDYFVPRIGHELDWLERLFRQALSFR
jgi:hypothetical protein